LYQKFDFSKCSFADFTGTVSNYSYDVWIAPILDNNTSDVKPISTATQSALDLKKPLDSISL
jgi:hypothetical protein